MTDCDKEVKARLFWVAALITASESKLGQHVNSTAKIMDMLEAEVLCGCSHASHLPVS